VVGRLRFGERASDGSGVTTWAAVWTAMAAGKTRTKRACLMWKVVSRSWWKRR
jgi:hypothetical protein